MSYAGVIFMNMSGCGTLVLMKPVLVSGSLAYDRIMTFKGNFSEHFMPDKLHSINVSFFVSPPKEELGGCAGNIAYSLSLTGTPSSIVGTAGTGFERYEAWLKEHGIDASTIVHRDDVPTSSGYIMTDEKDNQISAFSGGGTLYPYERAISYEDYALAIVSPNCKDDMVNLPAKFAAAGLPYFFDPGQQIPVLSGDELRVCIEGSAGVFVNDYELALVTEKTGWSEQDIVAKAGFLVVTLGGEGSRIVTNNGEERVAAVAVDTLVDPTGAGDAYRGGFIAGYVRELPLGTCAKVASTVAAHAVECYGTQNHRFTSDALAARYQGAYGEAFPF